MGAPKFHALLEYQMMLRVYRSVYAAGASYYGGPPSSPKKGETPSDGGEGGGGQRLTNDEQRTMAADLGAGVVFNTADDDTEDACCRWTSVDERRTALMGFSSTRSSTPTQPDVDDADQLLNCWIFNDGAGGRGETMATGECWMQTGANAATDGHCRTKDGICRTKDGMPMGFQICGSRSDADDADDEAGGQNRDANGRCRRWCWWRRWGFRQMSFQICYRRDELANERSGGWSAR
ncbi:hypothetical protein ACLOJK_022026 [Asimina triloba]